MDSWDCARNNTPGCYREQWHGALTQVEAVLTSLNIPEVWITQPTHLPILFSLSTHVLRYDPTFLVRSKQLPLFISIVSVGADGNQLKWCSRFKLENQQEVTTL